MDPIDQARRYVAAIDPAVSGSGGHNQTFKVACILIHGFALAYPDALAVLQEWNQTCQPPWKPKDLEHKLRDAERAHHEKPRGHLLKMTYKRSEAARTASSPQRTVKAAPAPASEAPAAKFAPDPFAMLPDPIPDGARVLLREAFREGEFIRIAHGRFNEESREVPADKGATLTREEWLAKLDKHGGNPNPGIYRGPERNGIYCAVNPFKEGGAYDKDVTAFRHVLLEFDKLDIEQQWSLLEQSNVPATVVVSSGGKSIHAWVPVEAASEEEYRQLAAQLYAHFAPHADDKNKNPSRFSRLANCERGKGRQELLAVNIGAKDAEGKPSFKQWLLNLELEQFGEEFDPDALEAFDPAKDETCLLGARWVCQGHIALFVGQSGIGKSSLSMQAAMTWAMGRPLFGIRPARPLKSVYIQAENDEGDTAEMYQGVKGGFGFLDDEQEGLLRRNLKMRREAFRTGSEFVSFCDRLAEREKPDLLWLDPANSFVGDDLSRQTVIAEFFRHGLNRVAINRKCAIMVMHHTGKPKDDAKARTHWQATDYSYAGFGSSDLTNAVRSVSVLQARGEAFELKLTKRGKRAGAAHVSGEPTCSLWLRHGQQSILWEQIEPPQEPEHKDKRARPAKKSKVEQVADLDDEVHRIITAIPTEGLSANALGEQFEKMSKRKGRTLGLTKCRTDLLDLLVERGKIAFDEESGCYRKGPQA